jgi:hypothetical protein
MLTQNLAIVDNHASLTLMGSRGSKTYNLVSSQTNGATLRREAATALTTPYELNVSHTRSGTGFKLRCRSLIKLTKTRLDTDVALTGGVQPSATAYIVLDRPINSNGYITLTDIKDLLGGVIDVVQTSGAIDSILNEES